MQTPSFPIVMMLLRGINAICLLFAQIGLGLLCCIVAGTIFSIGVKVLGFRQLNLSDFEIVEILTPLVVATQLPYVHLRGEMISLPIFTNRLPSAIVDATQRLSFILFALVYAVLCWRGMLGTLSFLRSGEKTIVLGWERWWGSAALTFMLGYTSFVCIVALIRSLSQRSLSS